MRIPNPNDAPLGTILPFSEGEVPEGWAQLNGDALDAGSYPDLWDALMRAPAEAKRLWTAMGGRVKLNDIVLPNPTKAEATAALFGDQAHPEMEFVLAIRAKRTDNE